MHQASLGRRLDKALLALQMAPQGSAIDYSKIVVSSTPDKKAEPPETDLSAAVWAEKAEDLVSAIECVLDGDPWSPTRSLSALKVAVRPLAGHASGYVAYALGESVERVIQARTALNVDAETGLAKPRPLTSRELPA